MKLIGTLVLFIVLLGSALAENKIEFHNDHNDADDTHSSDITYHSHKSESKKTSAPADCDHYHVHCSSLCLGVLIPPKQLIPTPFTYLTEESFSQELLIVKDFSISLYRPPIA